MRVEITKVQSSVPQGRLLSGVMFVFLVLTSPFIRALCQAHNNPMEGLWLQCIVYSATVYSLCRKARKTAKGEVVKVNIKNGQMWTLQFFVVLHKKASYGSLEWEKGVEI